MGTSYASVIGFKLPCPKCGREVLGDAQFYPSIGRFRGDMQRVRLGERLHQNTRNDYDRVGDTPESELGKPFPRIPLWEGRGYLTLDCDSCYPASHGGYVAHEDQPILDCVVQIRRGVVTAVLYPVPEDYQLTKGKGSKNQRKEVRRTAAWNEEVRRSHEERVRRLGTSDPMRLMADAMASPIRRELMYESNLRPMSQGKKLMLAKERMKKCQGIADLLKPSGGGRGITVTPLYEGQPTEFWMDFGIGSNGKLLDVEAKS